MGGGREKKSSGFQRSFSLSPFHISRAQLFPDAKDVKEKGKSLSRKGDPAISRENTRARVIPPGSGKRYRPGSFARVRRVPANTPESGSTVGWRGGGQNGGVVGQREVHRSKRRRMRRKNEGERRRERAGG